jgi:hypothetical protein
MIGSASKADRQLRGVDVFQQDVRGRRFRRAGATVAAMVIGIFGVAWSGCGDDGDDTTGAQESIERGVEEAKQGVEKGAKEVEQGLSNAKEEARKGIEKGAEEAEKGIEKGAEEAEKGIEKGQEEAERYAP